VSGSRFVGRLYQLFAENNSLSEMVDSESLSEVPVSDIRPTEIRRNEFSFSTVSAFHLDFESALIEFG